ncbi:hypothetical protein IPN35_01315 [Candidatus Peregrinibacteria bacterium]|nr:MAG: hypothetical protein IPN35_01315 [Candidatus Peregrinibacteria bacterium]
MIHGTPIVGQEKTLEKLKRILARKHLPNALLLWGPAGTGKFRMVREMAKLLFADYPSELREIQKNCSRNVVSIGDLWQADRLTDWDVISKTSNFNQRHRQGTEGEVAKKTDSIGVQDIASFLEPLFLRDQYDRKVGIIRDAERMTNEAANALLKTLEEPPQGLVFFLTTSHFQKLPQTIVSRCEMIPVPLASRDTLQNYMKSVALSEDSAEEMVTIAQGRGEYLIKLLNDSHFFEQEQEQFQEIARILSERKSGKRLKWATHFSFPEHAHKATLFLENFQRFLRSLLLEKIRQKKEFPLSENILFSDILRIYSLLQETEKGLSGNANKKLLFESFFLSLFP